MKNISHKYEHVTSEITAMEAVTPAIEEAVLITAEDHGRITKT